MLLSHFLSQTEREFKLQLVTDVKLARTRSKDTLFYWVHPGVKEVGCGTRQSKKPTEPYCVITIPLSCEQDGTGEVEECCSMAALAKTRDKKAPPSLDFGHRSFGVAQGERLVARLAREWRGQLGRVKGEDSEETPASCLTGTQRLELCRGDTGMQPGCWLLMAQGCTAWQLVGWKRGEKKDIGRGQAEEMGAKVLPGPQGGMVYGKLAGARC